MASLLAVDLGLRAGLALYGEDGRLIWYRSHNFGSAGRLRKGAYSILNEIPELSWMILEGGESLARAWLSQAQRREIHVRQISAETWRPQLLSPRQQRSGSDAKQHADILAREIIAWSGMARPTSLRHDAAEAILIGLWGVKEIGWLTELPI